MTYNGATLEADWTGNSGPLVEQFRIAGLGGNDDIRIDPSLDLSVLSSQSREFVTIIEGGPGNDTLVGSSARDRIDGGRGSDTISGLAGDDRLWGDQGPGDGSSTDHDVIFAGQGNDDVLGGQGGNTLYAWSRNPIGDHPTDPDAFGVFEVVDGELQLEDTGLNRIIGGPVDDELFGGTGLDLLYGGEGNNTLYTRTGETFESLDGGTADDAWKEYARSTDQVWYVGGTNADDQINLDFVTEPGILQGHHLMTRLTRNNDDSGSSEDFFTFDAQVRLDFSATDSDGNLIWNPNDLFADGGSLQDDDPFARAEMLNERFSDAVSLSRLLPPEDDFRAIIIDALAGNDQVNVGPTVQKTVWVDAGEGDDTVLIASGRSILIDQTDDLDARNDSAETAFELSGPPAITGTAITSPVLKEDATFFLIVDDLEDHIRVEVPASITDGSEIGTVANETLQDLVDDINLRISQTSASGLVVASLSGDAITLSGTRVAANSRLAISAEQDDPAVTELRLPAEDSAVPSSVLGAATRFTGLTIDNPSDVDHYLFQVAQAGPVSLFVESLNLNDGMQLALFAASDLETEIEVTGGVAELLAETNYVVRINSDAIPTVYELTIDPVDGRVPMVVDYATVVEFERQTSSLVVLATTSCKAAPAKTLSLEVPATMC